MKHQCVRKLIAARFVAVAILMISSKSWAQAATYDSPRIAATGISPSLSSADVAGVSELVIVNETVVSLPRDRSSISTSKVVAAVRMAFGGRSIEWARVDIDLLVPGKGSSGVSSVQRCSQLAKMAEILAAVKAAFPGTKWAWRPLAKYSPLTPVVPAELMLRSRIGSMQDWCEYTETPDPASSMKRVAFMPLCSLSSNKWSLRSPPTLAEQYKQFQSGGLVDLVVLTGPPVQKKKSSIARSEICSSVKLFVSLIRASATLTTSPATNSILPPLAPPAPPAAAPPLVPPAAAPPLVPPAAAPPLVPPAAPLALPVAGSNDTTTASTVSSSIRAMEAISSKLLAPRSGIPQWVPTNWDHIYDQGLQSPRLGGMMMQLNAMAIGAYDANSSRWIRPMQFQDIPEEMRDKGFLNITPEVRRDLYQLATVDTVQTSFLQSSGVVLAIVAHRTRNTTYIARCIELLEALNTYVPLQRPGSTYHDQNVSMTSDGDGVWLATAWGIDAIVEMLSALKDDVPVNLRDRLKSQLRQEVLRITTDWADKRPWFVKGRRPQSNQWIEPNIGLVKACMYLGDPALTDAYNLGAENIAASLAMYGADGSYPEGVSYAEMTLGRVHQIVHQMAIGGDARFVGVPFINNNWRWLVQMNMPGKMLVNSYDSAHSALYSWAVVAPLTSVSAAALSSSDPAALSAIRWLYPGLRGNCTLETIKLTSALEASSSLQTSIGLPTYDYFPDQQQLVWRSKFEPIDTVESTAWALWIRGGSLKDLHCHRDQGQVSVYAGNQIVLMDCGTPSYGDSIMESYYHAPAGHGVLQIGATQPYQTPVNAPISVGMLGVSGGSVTIDCTSAFSGTSSYIRSVNWDQLGRVEITDAVRLPSSVSAGSEVLRFHTGSVLPLEISGSSQQWRARWQGNEFVFNSDVDIEVTQVTLPDAVLPQNLHQALIVRLAAPATIVNVRSVLTVGVGTNSP